MENLRPDFYCNKHLRARSNDGGCIDCLREDLALVIRERDEAQASGNKTEALLQAALKREAIYKRAVEHYANRMDDGGTARAALREAEEVE